MIRKWMAIGIILLFVSVIIAPAIAQNTEEYQTSRGNWLYVGGNGPGNYTRIQDAIDNASDGDTIFVYDDSSPYFENVMVNKSINLFGENRETTIIDANGWGSPINLNTSFINISGFTVQNSGENQIDSGIVRDYYSSPFPRACDNITITGNKIINNNYGIYLSHSNNNSINYNIVTQNKMCGIDCAEGRSSNIKNNLITKNHREGINLYISYLFEITQNNLNDNNVGIRLWYSDFNYISENSILNSSSTGIDFFISYKNRILSNNFINNTKDAFFECALFRVGGNRFVNNYWDSNIGMRSKKILGIYDMLLLSVAIGFLYFINTGYYGFPEIIIPWFDFDWHPAREPYDIRVR
jgi:parallel beta-helix repeat protein